ncbi:group II intron reverse transcriptase/maturase, partial [Pseudoalteromonas sp. S4389]
PGIDGVIWNTDTRRMKAVNQLSRKAYQAKPLKRIYIPKKNGKLRPLGIPCMVDRALQALHLLALEPVSETLADPNSYGFRRNRSTADAIAQCFLCLSKKQSAQWVLEGDIKACFDKIGHQWLM